MKITLISSCVPGRQLQSRNHETVTFFLSTMEPLTHAANLPYVRFYENEFAAETAAENGEG
jgi:hypothetical protein